MKFTVFCFLLFAVSFSANAQHSMWHHKSDKEKMAQNPPSITRTLGASFQKFDGLSSRLTGLPQYQELKKSTATIGLGWLHEMNRVVSDAGITLGSSMSGHRDKKSSTVRYIGFNANLGYDVLKSEKITLYPLLGLGYQGYQAVFYKDNSGINFNDVLTSPAVQNAISPVRFTNGFLVYRAGAGVLFKSPKCPSGSIGLQAGYTGSFKKRAWRSNEGQALRNAPEDQISQFYVSLVLASNSWMRRR